MQMVKFQIPERNDRVKALETLTLRGRVVCLPDNVFIVPEPAWKVELARTSAALKRRNISDDEVDRFVVRRRRESRS